MMKSRNILILLLYTFSVMFFPWKDRVIFLWDDIEFLMQLRHFNVPAILEVHEYQFHPLFNLTTWLRIQFSGVNAQLFLLTSIFLHLINMIFAYRIIEIATSSRFFALLGAILVAFNKSYFTVIYWLAVHSNIMVTTILLVCSLIVLKLFRRETQRVWPLTVLLTIAPLFQGFGIGAGFVFAFIVWISWPSSSPRRKVFLASTLAGVLSLAVSAPFMRPSSVPPVSNIVSFTAAGVSQGLVTKFFIPGFVPNRFDPVNVGVMIAIPFVVLSFFVIALRKLRRAREERFFTLIVGLAFSVMPYAIAALGRATPGALGGLAERYIYPPFFFFIIALVTALSVFVGDHLTIRKKMLLIVAVLSISIGHQLAMFRELNTLFLKPPL